MYKLALALFSLFAVIASPAAAAGNPQAHWVVTQLSGDARVIHPGLQSASLKVNGELAAGDTLLTGPTGRATLVRGADYIVVAPASELKLPAQSPPAGFTRVIQMLGTMLFKVQHTGIPHFAVDTPMLAAVVKGTTFTVVVEKDRSAVQVIQGVVQVSTIDGSMSRMVEGGRTVFVNRVNPKMLLDADKPAPASETAPATGIKVSAGADMPATAISTLTGGLVRGDVIASQTPVVTAATPFGTQLSSTPGTSTTATSTDTTVEVATSGTGASTSTVSVGSTSGSGGATVVTASNTTTSPNATVSTSTTTVSSGIVTQPTLAASTSTPIVTASSGTVTTPTVAASTSPTPTVTVSSSTVTTPTATVSTSTAPVLTSSSGTLSTPTVIASTAPTVPTLTLSTATVTTPTATVSTPVAPTVTVPSVTVATPAVTVPNVIAPVTTTVQTVTTVLGGLLHP
jgi:hypothetical protein